MPDAKEILAAAKEAAQAVAAWGEAVTVMVSRTEALAQALAEATAHEDAQASYNAARNIDDEGDGLGGSSMGGGWSSSFAARREAATALQAKRIAEAAAAEAKRVAEAALQKAAALAGQT